jgi:hypothetical protein
MVVTSQEHPQKLRTAWPPWFPPVHVHARWDEEGYAGQILPEHPSYWPAKTRRNAPAAIKVCDDLAREEVLESLFDLCHSESKDPPIVVAPAAALHDTQNALAIGYARWLASEMRWDVEKNVYQAKTVSRDFVTNGWFRLIHQPEFYGTVQAGRRYVIADDVCTMGGTIAGLRGFIESQGGHVIAATALASRYGMPVPIALAQPTLLGLTTVFAGRLNDLCQRELGYGLLCLTDPEGRFLLRCSSFDEVRAGIDGARQC